MSATFVTPAVVVGLCAHGLALVRSLARAGVPVTALEANPDLPGFHTRHARVMHVPDINGEGLIHTLEALPAARSGQRPVLFVTNDNMVSVVAQHWPRLAGDWRLSWAESRVAVQDMLLKSSLEQHCQQYGLKYPRSVVLDDLAGARRALAEGGVSLPLIIKPVKPLSGFKVRLVRSLAELGPLFSEHARALPFLAQQWIEGTDRTIRFTAFYLKQGRSLATFTGRKLASRPPALGQTTVAEAFPAERVQAMAERFFAPLALSGPVSLELKLDRDGEPWVIEPTLGRTDYWLDCCVANGVNLPLMEYLDQCGEPIPEMPQQRRYIWFDTERAPACRWQFLLSRPGWIDARGQKPVFPYSDPSDPGPRAQHRRLRREALQGKAARAMRRLFSGRPRRQMG